MKKPGEQLKVIWELNASAEAADRLLAAFEMIFKDVPITLPDDGPFDKD